MNSIQYCVIAEYNPLHSGHEFLIKTARERLNASACVVILSSNFTQRGSPAIVDKFYRAQMAISCGADLVIELPSVFSCSAGQDFASSAVSLLARTKLATHIAFGMETPEFNFNHVIDILLHEPPEYKKYLHLELGRGASFSKAAALALEHLAPGSEEFIKKPNNMLGLSYILNIKKKGLKLVPLIIRRKGSFSSALIRSNLNDGLVMMPESSRKILEEAKNDGRLCPDDSRLWPLLQSALLRSSTEDLKRIHGIDEGIENLFLKNWKKAENLEDFIGRCVSARYTRSHVRRRIMNILLGLDRLSIEGIRRTGVPYARVLAFNETGRKLLKAVRGESELPIITRLAEAKKHKAAQFEFRASELYELLLENPDMKRETKSVLKFLS